MGKTSNLKLNKEQIEAIEYGDGPLLIIAGAGTGKTTVITERVKNLIMSGRAKPEEILALTFTEKGAREMEERIDVALPYGYTQMWVMTFHSFCDQILRDNAIHIGLSPSYKLMTTAQAIDLVRKNLFELDLDYFRPLGNPNKFIDGLLNHFSRLQDELVTPEDYLKYTKKLMSTFAKASADEKLDLKKQDELSKAYFKYGQIKIRDNFSDFGDLITNTIKLFTERPNTLKIYQDKFKYVLVDEFQDTNFAQNQLAIMLAGKRKNITAVGDDDQSIYRFRGASVSNIVQFRKFFPKTRVIVLTKNYRSTQEILDRSYDLIQHNNPDRLEMVEKIDKKLVASSKQQVASKDNIEFIHTESVSEEAHRVVEEIIRLTNPSPKLPTTSYNFSDIAILVRANSHADSFTRELERQGIPNQFLGPSNLFEKEEVMDLISYLRVLYNPEDSESFYRLLSSDIFDISPIDLIKISSHAKKSSLSIFEVATESDSESIKKLLSIIDKHLKVINKQTAGEILYDYIQEVGLLQKLVENSEDIKAKNIAKFFEKIKAYEDENPTSPRLRGAGKNWINDVVDYIDLLIEVGESPNVTDGDWQENDAVNILTVHSSKGLEFPIVFLVNLVGERFPGRERHEQIPIPQELIKEVLPMGDFHLQEERRLFYVGMTRAKEKLYFSAADYYGEAKRKKKISPFVGEALGEKELSYMPYAVRENQLIRVKAKSIKREAYSIKQSKIDYLSVSQIETFQTCPLHYKLKYIYKLPTKSSASSSFGISIHNTLKEYYENPKNILKIYKEKFIEDGYLNKKHKQEFYKKGESYLLGFIKNGYDKKTKTILLEEKFVLPIDSTLKIGGTIDRVDDLSGGKVEIIDYKTGANMPTQKEVDKDLQLSFYALAISSIKKIKPEDINLSLYYLDNQEKITTTRTTSQLEKVKEEILAIREEIENSDFKCNNNFFCQGKCEYSMFCKSGS